jgi:hypothetical protein
MGSRALNRTAAVAALCAVLLTLAGASSAAPRALLTDNLVSYWELEEASAVRYDSAGANDLTDNNTVGSAAGVVSNAGSFVAANSEYLSIASNSSVETGDIDFSVSFWVYANTLIGLNVPVARTFSGLSDWYFQSSNGTLTFSVQKSDNSESVSASGVITTTAWYHVVGWYVAADKKSYLSINNGVPVTSSVAGWSTRGSNTVSPFHIGNLPGFGRYWDGKIDEVGFWKKALTSDERTTLYNGGIGCAYVYLNTGCAAPTATPTNTSTPGPTNTPTNTPVPTNTPTPTPLPTATPVGEYQIPLSDGQVGIIDNRFTAADVIEILLLAVIAGGDILWRARQQTRGLK